MTIDELKQQYREADARAKMLSVLAGQAIDARDRQIDRTARSNARLERKIHEADECMHESGQATRLVNRLHKELFARCLDNT